MANAENTQEPFTMSRNERRALRLFIGAVGPGSATGSSGDSLSVTDELALRDVYARLQQERGL